MITGGTVFVSRYAAAYYVSRGYKVHVLNRNTKPQVPGVHLIECDRHNIGDKLKGFHFDAVMDIAAYDDRDIMDLTDALDSFDTYIMISSSAVYPEYGRQPFMEEDRIAENRFWGKYGTDKILAENALLQRVPGAYILRPPYLYGPMNNVYREAFVFQCALEERPFYLPGDGLMKLQFFHVKDLCRFMDCLLTCKPHYHIFNVGNKQPVSVREWVASCYHAAGKEPQYINVYKDIPQRNYFSFYDYEYYLDVEKMHSLMISTTPLEDGLFESFLWYTDNRDKVQPKPFMKYIDENFLN